MGVSFGVFTPPHRMRSEIPNQVVIVDWDKKTYAHELLTLQRTRIVFEGVNREDAGIKMRQGTAS